MENNDSKTILFDVCVSGNLDNVGVERAKRAFLHLQDNFIHSKPPCDGGVLLVSHARWECRDNVYIFVQTDTWKCPDGSLKEVETILEKTNDKC